MATNRGFSMVNISPSTETELTRAEAVKANMIYDQFDKYNTKKDEPVASTT